MIHYQNKLDPTIMTAEVIWNSSKIQTETFCVLGWSKTLSISTLKTFNDIKVMYQLFLLYSPLIMLIILTYYPSMDINTQFKLYVYF